MRCNEGIALGHIVRLRWCKEEIRTSYREIEFAKVERFALYRLNLIVTFAVPVDPTSREVYVPVSVVVVGPRMWMWMFLSFVHEAIMQR